MLNTDIAAQILNGLFLLDSGGPQNLINFNHQHLYLGLLTKLPKPTGEAYADDDNVFYREPEDKYYMRIKLDPVIENPTEDEIKDKAKYVNTINNQQFLSEPTEEAEIEVGTAQDPYIPVSVINNALILFPEPAQNEDEPEALLYTIVGFGLFPDGDTSQNTVEAPIMWGPVLNQDGQATKIEIRNNMVPIIRAGNFKITMM